VTWVSIRLHRLIESAVGGVWGDEPGTGDMDVKCVRAADFDYAHLTVHPRNLPTRSVSKKDLSTRRLRKGDLVLEKSGGGELQPVGRVVHWDLNETAVTSNFAARIRPASGTSGRFLAYLMASLYGTGTTKKSVKQTTGIQNLDLANYLDERVAVPKEVEQRAIADFLDAETARIDALIAKKRRMIELLLSRRTVTTIYSVSGKLNSTDMMAPSSLPWLEELSAAWDEVLLRLVARLGSGHTPSRNHPEWWLDCAIPWITTGEVQALRSDRVEYIEQTREMISEIGLANSAAELHSEDTVVLCRTASAGYSGIMSSAMATSQDFATWTCGPLLRPRFLLLCLRAMREDLLGRLAMGSTHKTIYMPDIRSIRIPLPSMEEQDRVVEAAWGELARIDKAMTFLERQIVLLRERRQALITAAVTGEIGVPGVRK